VRRNSSYEDRSLGRLRASASCGAVGQWLNVAISTCVFRRDNLKSIEQYDSADVATAINCTINNAVNIMFAIFVKKRRSQEIDRRTAEMEPDHRNPHHDLPPHQSSGRPQPLSCHFGGYRDASQAIRPSPIGPFGIRQHLTRPHSANGEITISGIWKGCMGVMGVVCRATLQIGGWGLLTATTLVVCCGLHMHVDVEGGGCV
jgi:hypothetical protein